MINNRDIATRIHEMVTPYIGIHEATSYEKNSFFVTHYSWGKYCDLGRPFSCLMPFKVIRNFDAIAPPYLNYVSTEINNRLVYEL
jgi:hypothetical protein